MKRTLLFLAMLCAIAATAQSAKKLYKQGLKEEKAGSFEAAATSFGKALIQKPNTYNYLVARGRVYEKLRRDDDAVKDYTSAFNLSASDEKLVLHAVDLDLKLSRPADALALTERILVNDKYNIDALEKKAWCQILLHQFNQAVQTCDMVFDKNKYNHTNLYQKGLALDSLKRYDEAADFYLRAVKLMRTIAPNDIKPLPVFKPYFYNLGAVQIRLKQYDDALKNLEQAANVDLADTVAPKNYLVYDKRHEAYLGKTDFNNAINDLNKAVVMQPGEAMLYVHRADVYARTNQYQSAISDYTKALQINDKSADVYFKRGKCRYELLDLDNSLKDFGACLAIEANNTEAKKLYEDTRKKIYEAGRESDAPDVRVEYPTADPSGFINVYMFQQDLIVEGTIRDRSLVESVTVDGVPATFRGDDKNPVFSCRITLNPMMTRLDIVAKDIYHNASTKTLKLGRLIGDTKSQVTLAGRLLSDDGTETPLPNRSIYLRNEKGEIFFAGKTDAQGYFKFDNLPYDRNYLMTVDVDDDPGLAKLGRFKVTDKNNKTILRSQSTDGKHFQFELLPNDMNTLALMTVDDTPLRIDLRGRLVADDANKTPLANISIMLYDGDGKLVDTKKADALGSFRFSQLDPGKNYTLSTDAKETSGLPYTKIYITDERGKVIREISRSTLGVYKFDLLPNETAQLSAVSDFDPWLRSINLDAKKSELTIIESIYYESGSYQVLPDAQKIIDKAVDALKANGKLMLEVQSHTDAVAGDEYNMELSQKRANAVVDYIVSKGIDKKRLTAKGFGETELINHCKNGVDCSDEEHRQNRRTVFKMIYPTN